MEHSYMLELNTPTEPSVDKLVEDQKTSTVLDLSKTGLKKVPKPEDTQHVKELILDENLLQKIDNVDTFLKIEKISLCKNNLLRMFGLSRLHMLQEINLSNNAVVTIEGLKELVHLRHLNLQGNTIKSIEHLNTNVQLEYLNLAENSIGSISDISVLKNLKELYLHGNRLTHLRQCDRYLPVSIETLTLDHNNIADLNEICTLSGLTALNSISIQENPCVQMTNSVFIYKSTGFDYRPFVLNWCMTVKVIDGFAVNPIESLKAEWLYSQGRGRQFRIGEQIELAKYLSSVCPLTGEALENEEDRKLRLILSKAQQHQRQLKEEISDNSHSSANNSPSTNRRRGTSNRIQSPRVSRLGRANSGSPDSMSSSYHGNTSSSLNNDANNLIQMSSSLIENVNAEKGNIMVQSLDPTILSSPSSKLTSESTSVRSVVPPLNDYQTRQCPLVATSKIVPVPETLMSPDCPPLNVVHQSVIHSTPKTEPSLPNQKVSSIKSTKESKLMSPKSRTSLTKKQEKSPVLNVRKNNSINTALKAHQTTNHSHSDSPSVKKTLAHKTQSPPPLLAPVKQSVSYTPDNMSNVSSDDDSDHFSADKLKTIRNKAAQRSQEHSQSKDNTDASSSKPKLINQNSTEESAIVIQKIWRGYNTRKINKHIAKNLQKNRTQQHIEKLSHDMETTKVALENERKIQQLQMQAINALWKKVSTLQPPAVNASAIETAASSASLEPNSTAVVQDLAKTCSVLTNQVQQLQGSMRDIIQCMSVLYKLPNQGEAAGLSLEEKKPEVKDSSSTQTEIVAVHTPQVENLPFPFASKLPRPSTLSLTDSNGSSASIRKISEREGDETTDSERKLDTAESTSTDNKDETPEISAKSDGDGNQSKKN
ncbi:centrosomal protein of 97 kDa [Sitodiplosis mosellana]|uniref:centrosomal protein of 97 kDa n=1 Tax=Sitodiplosis mosellana TaxID=263140 RepID=UPI0024446B55|nr:centrosomal protein of 97 kDa [Sitodiplosis mosellana]